MTARGAADWDRRYAETTRPWPRDPSPTVTDAVGSLPPGSALDLAAGTGRHALWLASRGWEVTAVDFSAVGLGQGRRRAAEAGLVLTWVQADVLRWEPLQQVDLVLVVHVQLGEQGLRRAATWLRPGGRLVVVGHALRNLETGEHGPRSPELLHTPELLLASVQELEVERLEEVERSDVTGTTVELLLVARRPLA